MREEIAKREVALARIAEGQWGVVTVAQLEEVGIDRSAVSRRVGAGRLHRLHRGVYAVGHRSLSWRGRWMAAVFAAGDGAVLSHHSAAPLWEFIRPIAGPIDVSVGRDTGRARRAGINLHRSRTLGPGTVTRRHGSR